MHHRRKFMALSAVAATGLAAGCSAGAGGGALGEGDTADGASITVITSQAPWNPAYDAVVAAYEEETGVDVELRSFPNDEVKSQMLNDQQSGGHAFDVYQINEVDLAQFNANGLLLPFTDVDPDYAFDDEVFTYDDLPYWSEEKQAFAADGALTSAPLMGNLQVFVYRTDLYDQLGLSVPTTWDDALANAEEVVDSEATRYGFTMRTQGVPGSPGITYDFSGLLYGEGGSFFTEPGVDWTPALDTPEALRAATLLRDLAATGPADPQAVGQAEAIAAMQAGDTAQLDVVAAAASSMNDEASSNVVGKVGFAPLPGASSATGLWTLGMPADLPDERQAAALDFITWVTSEKGMEVFAENGGIPTRADAYDAPGLSEESRAYLDAVRESAPTAVGPLRLTFITDFLEVTEPVLAAIAAGDVSPEDGLAQLQEQLTAVVEDAGVATS